MIHLIRTITGAAILTLGIAAHAEVAGAWAITWEGRQGTNHNVLTIEQTDDGHRGHIAGPRGERAIDAVTVEGDTFSLTLSMRSPMGMIDLTYSGHR